MEQSFDTCHTAQVAPSELEDLIRQHEGVVDVAVTGIPDERSGEYSTVQYSTVQYSTVQ